MKKLSIDLSLDTDELHAMLAAKLDFPDYYGRNLDALYDLLSVYDSQVEFSFTGASEYGERLKKTVADAAHVNENITVAAEGAAVDAARAKLTALQAKMAAYQHAMGVIYYDGVTVAPSGTAANRAQTMGVLSEESYKLAAGDETVELLEYLDAHQEALSEKERRMVYLLLKSIRSMRKIPMDEYVEYEKLLVEADAVWHRAKELSDFELCRPLLEKIFETNIRFAGYIAPDKHPYDYWLGEYEDGLTMEKCDAFFSAVRKRLVPLLKKVASVPQVSDACLWGDFPKAGQMELSGWIMSVMGIDRAHCTIGETEHPFTTSLGSHFDERITTNYKDNLSFSMYSVLHEGGHALYDMGSDEDLAYTVLDGGVSMGIHESQSRFYENILGRSRAFVSYAMPKLRELFPALADCSDEEFFKAVNRVDPSLIRTEADEVTYCLHIMVRYELEKAVMSGELSVAELPAEWNRLYKEYLGIDVPDDKRGVLQDSHWSGGSIGYFPSYALGSAYGAQFLKKMRESVDVEACLEKGDFAPINEWNRRNIWRFGSLYTPARLLERVLGEEFDPEIYLDYLEDKCRQVYGI